MCRKTVEQYWLGFPCFALIFGMLTVGCSGAPSDAPKTHEVSGTVTLDGAPVAEGRMVFLDPAGMQKSYGTSIKAGKFSTAMTSGKKKVEITAMRESKDKKEPGPSGGPLVPVLEQYIPAEYNKKTMLEADISDSGSNELTFDLKSK